jgi:hypothetical protein
MAYLTLAGLKLLSVAPDECFSDLESRYPGWTDATLAYWSSWIDAQLRKRYAAPFSSPYPVAVEGWLARLVTAAAYHKRGIDPTDRQVDQVIEDAAAARAEVMAAANGDTGRWDLPLRADTTATGISKGGPLVYTETNPYDTWDIQRDEYDRSH